MPDGRTASPTSRQALLVAVPVIVDSLGPVPVGALTGRDGGHRTTRREPARQLVWDRC